MVQKTDNISILVLEDDPVQLQFFNKFIVKKLNNYKFTITDNIKEAKEILETSNFDLIISDYILLDGTLFDILPFFKSKNIPFIVITGSGDEDIAVKAMKNGACDYIIKDVETQYFKVLPVTIENVLKSKFQRDLIHKLTLAIEQNPSMIVIADLEGIPEYINKEYTANTGYTLNELKDNHKNILDNSRLLNEQKEEIFTVLFKEDEWKGQLCFYKSNGQEIWEDVTLRIIKNDLSENIGILKTSTDFTDEKHMEIAIEKLSSKL